MAEVPSSKKPAAKAAKPVAAVSAKPVSASPTVKAAALVKPAVVAKVQAPVTAKPAATKPAVPQPVAAKPIAPAVAKPVKPVAAAPAVVAPVAKPAAPVAAPAPVARPAVKQAEAKQAEVKPVEVKPVETKPTPIEPVAAVPVAAPLKETIMNDTITKVQDTFKNTTEEATAKASAFFNDANGRAKDALAKGTKAVEELVEFSKGNLEAVVASGRVAAKGAEDIAKYSAEYGRTSIEKANATAKQFAAVKSPTEFFQLQGDVAKQTLDSLVAEGSKFTESYLKLVGEVFQPIQNRVAVAVEKAKTTVAA